MAFTLVQISLSIEATVGHPPRQGNPTWLPGTTCGFVLWFVLIALAGIPNTLQYPTLLCCSLQLGLQPLRPHFSYKPHPLCFAYCSHLSNAATDIWPNAIGDRFRHRWRNHAGGHQGHVSPLHDSPLIDPYCG